MSTAGHECRDLPIDSSAPLEGSLHSLWRRQVALGTERCAVEFGEQSLTYAELDARSNQLANVLRSRGVGPRDCVAICLPRSLDVPIAVLAVLKAGAAYVPLDPRYPRERLDFMLAESGVRVLLMYSGLRELLPFDPARTICLDTQQSLLDQQSAAFVASESDAELLAYVIYTSGSTGRPKGVAMGRAPLENLIRWQTTASHAGIGTRTLQYTPLSFDVHFQELFGTWATGGTLVLIDDETRLDPTRLLRLLDERDIHRLFLPFIALQSLAEAGRARGAFPTTLREVITAGEQLQITADIAAWFSQRPDCSLHNHYGPSETHVVTAFTMTGPASTWPKLPPIGLPLPGVVMQLRDEQGAPRDDGQPGELFIAGRALADGYYRRPELTHERFSERDGRRWYRTGDLVRKLPDGHYEYLGRVDGQVKVRGHRVELGEIEIALSAHPAVRLAAVAAFEASPGITQLSAFVVLQSNAAFDSAALRAFVAERLPDYMVPAYFTQVDDLPKTPSGKVDRRALPLPKITRPELAQEFVAPKAGLEAALAHIWRTLLRLDRVGVHDPFFELGGNSLLTAQVLTRLRQSTGREIPLAIFFRYPTIAGLVRHLETGGNRSSRIEQRKATASTAIAVVGMAGRFPGADNVAQLWQNLRDGIESVTFFADDELDRSVPLEQRGDPAYVKARGILSNVENFDAAFFGIGAREAELMDPQQRLFLETAWQALEDAGCVPEQFAGSIGVYAGAHNNSYYPAFIARRPDLIARFGEFPTMLANEKDYLATRTAYALSLQGPALSINTACSTSLVAVVQAVEALISGQCDLALAGGVAVVCPQNSGYVSQDGGMLSPDGHCRPFDAAASGTLFSNGVGVVVLKRLEDALAANDTIYAVLKGAALNNDGARKMSFTAPAVDGQADVIAMAQSMAGFAPETIGYVEAHGTATPLGDPVEIEALTQAFRERTDRKQFCAIGSIKGNLGHLVSAAGVAGLIKTCLALHHEQLPPTVHFRTPNPRIDWPSSPFHVVDRLTAWPRGERPRRAAVSSFGVGGTNAHVVLEEAPVPTGDAKQSPGEELLLISGRSREALDRATTNLADYLSDTSVSLADIAYTLQRGRKSFAERRFIVATSAGDAAVKLRASSAIAGRCEASDADVAFMFPGQGTQYAGMGRELYEREPVFRAWFDRCADIAAPILSVDLRAVVFAGKDGDLEQTQFAQPALFSLGYALAQLWMSWGVSPTYLLGHSVGEFVAACLADVFSLDDGLRLVTRRAALMQAQPAGAMLSVRMPADKVAAWLDETCAIASINAPALCVVSGPDAAVARLESRCQREEIICKRLRTSHAFHSPMMDPVVAPFAAEVRDIPLSPPRIPIFSTVSAAWLTDAQATDPAYWAGHLRATVRFGDAVAGLLKDKQPLLLEVGPGTALATLARQQPIPVERGAISSLEGAKDGERAALLKAAGRLWLAGTTPNLDALHPTRRRRVPLPTYPFQRQRFWADPPETSPIVPETLTRIENPVENAVMAPERKQRLTAELCELFEDLSGRDLSPDLAEHTFFELGLDSLLLTQACLVVQKKFKAPLTFRQLMEDFVSPARLAEYLDRTLPPEPVVVKKATLVAPIAANTSAAPNHVPSNDVRDLIHQQLQLMARQLELLGAAPSAMATLTPSSAPSEPPKDTPNDVPRPFGAAARITLKQEGLTPSQQAALADITRRYTDRTRSSKEHTQRHRAVLADPRVVSGFRPETKEIVYPIVVKQSRGATLIDIDDNEYIDLTCGFGSNFFGYAPPFIADAIAKQLQIGYEIGPQHPLAGDVATRISQFVGLPRVVFCNTGSEAVLGALRLARTTTGRNTVVVFNGSYHGIVDEVIVRTGKNGRSLPAAAGIPASAVENLLVLDYGTPEALATIRERADDLAAVLVEPVQSRHPDLQPREFLHEVRKITEQAGAALIFDEVITGFRLGTGGAQEWFGIRADLATYGKVVGGGLPIGIIAGSERFMDGLDGGTWSFGDSSFPQAGVTYFAGTFVRHPLALAAADAVLRHLENAGPALYEDLNARTARLVGTLNDWFAEVAAPLKLESCGSLFKVIVTQDVPLPELLQTLLRLRGIHIWDARPCFLTTAHTDADVDHIVARFQEAVRELQTAGFYPAPPPAEVKVDRAIPSTSAQKEIWVASRFGADASCAFNESVSLRLRGRLNRSAFARAFQKLIDRHELLRTTFSPDDGRLQIAARMPIALTHEDIADRPDRLPTILTDEVETPFDLESGPLVRGRLLRMGVDDHWFVLSAHHSVCDGWSMAVLLQDLALLATGASLPPSQSFSDYARWAEAQPNEAALTYWRKRLDGELPTLQLPTDRPQQPMRTYAANRYDHVLSAELVASLKKLGAASGASFFTVLFASFAAFQSRLTGQNDLLIGVPAAGQSASGLEGVVGHCVNLLPLRCTLDAAATFKSWLTAARTEVLDAYDHQQISYGDLLPSLKFRRDPSRPPLVSVAFNLDRAVQPKDVPFAGLSVEYQSNPRHYESFEWFVNAAEAAGVVTLEVQYNTDLFDDATIPDRMESFEALLAGAVANPNETIARLPLLSAAQRNKLLVEWNATEMDYPRDKSVATLLREQAERTPERPALTFGETTLSYGELNRRSNQLAHHLVAQGVGRGMLVALCVERSIDMIVGQQAILKAGAGYLPLDPKYPRDRLAFMLGDSRAPVVLTHAKWLDLFKAETTRTICLERDVPWPSLSETAPAVSSQPSDVAYVLYTSGSTGQPKGVAVPNAAVVNYMASMRRWPGMTADDTLLAVTTLSFDISVTELLLPLTVGAHVILASQESASDGPQLVRLLESHRATVMQGTPATWRLLLQSGWKGNDLFKIWIGGEALPADLARALLPCCDELVNLYGPTETTVWSTGMTIADPDQIRIGRPFANTHVYVLDANLQPVPIGVPGELLIGGAGVALGYLHRPELTAQRFIDNPYHDPKTNVVNPRLYRTGDLVRWLHDGTLEYFGRNDNQVKLRGMRIELGEIEATLARHPGVEQAVACVRTDRPNDPRLVAYILPRPGQTVTTTELRKLLRQNVPDYMVPQHFVELEEFPLTNNGKVDRNRLPAPFAAAPREVKPETSLSKDQRYVLKICREAVGVANFGIDDNFFQIGGHSLLAMEVLARFERDTGKRLSPRELVLHPLSQVAELLPLDRVPV